MNGRAPLGRFVRVARNFGFGIAIKVAYSKVRGRLCPALALPEAPTYGRRPRELSLLVNAGEQSVATLEAIVEVVSGRCERGWEICICGGSWLETETARALEHLRGTGPWIRIVMADASIDKATAARWALEQATGQFVALLAPRYVPAPGTLDGLLAGLRDGCGIEAGVLVKPDSDSGSPPSSVAWTDCCLLLQRKSSYLAALAGRWLLNAPSLARYLHDSGMPVSNVAVVQE